MNRHITEAQWKQLRGELRSTWTELTDDEIDAARCAFDQIACVFHEKYGLEREHVLRKLSALACLPRGETTCAISPHNLRTNRAGPQSLNRSRPGLC